MAKGVTGLNLLYIHSTKDLNPKSADIEATFLIRELKKSNKLPFSEDKISNNFSPFFVSHTDLDAMYQALDAIPLVTKDIIKLVDTEGIYEPINLKRAVETLQEVPEPLKRSIAYIKEVYTWQESFVPKITQLLNKIASIKDEQEKKACEVELGQIFEKILRNNQAFRFNSSDIIDEGLFLRIRSLAENINKGYFFHISLEEHLRNSDFNMISKRISAKELEKVTDISKQISKVKDGIERAYESNLMMINLVVILYSYVRWLSSPNK